MQRRARRQCVYASGRRTSAIRRFFTGLTEYAFHARLGVADPPLVDYIAELLVRFVRSDELYPVRSVRGQRLVQVTDMLAEAQHREGPARQQVHRHIGDFTLFWTGVYPEVVEQSAPRQQGRADRLPAARQAGVLDREHDPGRKGSGARRRAEAAQRAVRAVRVRPRRSAPPMGAAAAATRMRRCCWGRRLGIKLIG